MSLASSPPSETSYEVPACDINAPFSLQDKEKRWLTLYPLLLERGYRLPPRYRPGWIGSWIRDGVPIDAVDPIKYEDAFDRTLCVSGAVDAERVSDGKTVAIKIAFSLREAEAELPILRYFSQPELVNHPLNHCVPLLDTFRLQMGTEELVIIVEPFVGSPAHPLLIVGVECLPYVRQMLEALYFMHMHNTAHRDIFVWNIAMDSSRLFPRGYNPLNDRPKGNILKAFPKSGVDFVETPGSRDRIDLDPDDVKYYFLDFDASIQFASPEERQLVARGVRRLNAAPEEGEDGKSPCDPFPIDVYSLGQYFLYDEAFADIDKTVCVLNDFVMRPHFARATGSGSTALAVFLDDTG
ncbi:hypothetical protein R3P38DRAFT_2530261 [Favolaschia claudopus]|uniref:Protein kinase domain-containing protein n=1 Tax=Favolaschia claudopus TaxID=2862362 RepID=A0AAW0BG99_9AGAR